MNVSPNGEGRNGKEHSERPFCRKCSAIALTLCPNGGAVVGGHPDCPMNPGKKGPEGQHYDDPKGPFHEEEQPEGLPDEIDELAWELTHRDMGVPIDTDKIDAGLERLNLRALKSIAVLESHKRVLSKAIDGDRAAIEKVEALVENLQNAPPPVELVQTFRTYEPIKWLVQHYLPIGEVGIISGGGGLGKTRLAVQIACELALGGGRDILGDGSMVTQRQGRTLILTWEDSIDHITKTIHDVAGKDHLDLIEQNVGVMDLAGRGGLYAPSGSGHLMNIGERTRLFYEIHQVAKDFRPDWIVIDTITSAFQSQESERGLVRPFLSIMQAMAREFDACVGLLAHTSKAEPDKPSGSTDWTNGVRIALNLAPDPKTGQQVLTMTKTNLSRRADPVHLVPDRYPYRAGIKIPDPGKETKYCAGYDGYECDEILPEGTRAMRCDSCKQKHRANGRR